jgi:hypothetical protein
MEGVSTLETSVDFYEISLRNISEDGIFILAGVRIWNL